MTNKRENDMDSSRYDNILRRDAGVPDGWADAYAAFKGAFDTPASWLKDNSEYANDARKRLREFNEAMLAAAPQHGRQDARRDSK